MTESPGAGEPATPFQMRALISRAFTPAAPITTVSLFAGRKQQMNDVVEVILNVGQHAVIYGERGVGKTSLTTVMKDVLGGTPNYFPLRVNCDATDDYSSIWRKVFAEARFAQTTRDMGFDRPALTESATGRALVPATGPISPNDVRVAFEVLRRAATEPVAFIDEFDRLKDPMSRALFADTIKTLSDQLTPATIVLVGVADNVDELISEHRSIERALLQIPMPRMSQDELADIVNRGLEMVAMTIQNEARSRITRLSQGLPHYTHLVSQAAARAAVDEGGRHISIGVVDAAIRTVVSRTQESIISSHHKATFSTRETLYEEVLLACALAPVDDLGYFASADVRGPLSEIMGRRYEIPAFSPHLNALSESDRGAVLEKKGSTRKFKYRFVNPLLQPYVIMRGLADGKISGITLDRFAGPAHPPGMPGR